MWHVSHILDFVECGLLQLLPGLIGTGFSQEPSSVEKIMEIDEHIGCAMSGLIADARTLVEHARVETQVL